MEINFKLWYSKKINLQKYNRLLHCIFFIFSSQIHRNGHRREIRQRPRLPQLFNRHVGKSRRNTSSLGMGAFQLGVPSGQIYPERPASRFVDPINHEDVRHADKFRRNGMLLRQLSRCWCWRHASRESIRDSIQ